MWIYVAYAILVFLFISTFFLIRRGAFVDRALYGIRRPEFFFRDMALDKIGIPVFTYHSIANKNTDSSVTPLEFERHLQYLVKNGYQTLSADEYFEHITHHAPVPQKSVVITFDDGRATFWTIAFPIIKKYDVKVVCFLVPGAMQEKGMRPGLNFNDSGAIQYSQTMIDADLSDNPIITWEEAREMHSSGLVDFQSHTIDHSRIFVSPKIVDFIHPGAHRGYNRYRLPVTKNPDFDHQHPEAFLGMPLYENDSRMGASRRYLEDEDFHKACLSYVQEGGGKEFFKREGWRAELEKFCSEYQKKFPLLDNYESPQEQIDAIRHNLSESRNQIQLNLPDHQVKHICFPWHRYSSLSLSIARETGYVTAWIDLNPQKLVKREKNNPYLIEPYIPINCLGDDPFFISRIDAQDDVILSLPGSGRYSLTQRVMSLLFKLPNILSKLK